MTDDTDNEAGIGQILLDSADRLLTEICDQAAFDAARDGELIPGRWKMIEEFGLPMLLVDDETMGLGASRSDGWAVVKRLGFHAAPYPIAETMIANQVLVAAGLPIADGPAALVPVANRIDGDTAKRVAWGRAVRTIVAETNDGLLRGTGACIEPGSSIAGLPRDTLHIDAGGRTADHPGLPLNALGALVRAVQMAGALDHVLALTLGHVSERVQFGRPLSTYQAIQQSLAICAGEVAAASAAADHAVEASGGDRECALFAIAVARARIGEAASRVAAIAHQLHGAIGFAAEHPLHRLTTALWTWRDEFGTQRSWTDRVGSLALAAGRDGYWPMVTAA